MNAIRPTPLRIVAMPLGSTSAFVSPEVIVLGAPKCEAPPGRLSPHGAPGPTWGIYDVN